MMAYYLRLQVNLYRVAINLLSNVIRRQLQALLTFMTQFVRDAVFMTYGKPMMMTLVVHHYTRDSLRGVGLKYKSAS